MTILFMTRKFPPSTGGMENYAYDLYSSLKNKVEVRIIKWGKSNKYLPIVLPYFFLKGLLVLLRGNIDVVHAQDGVLAPLGYLLSRISHKPFAVVIHGLDITYKNGVFQAIIPKFVAKADVVFCISQAAADEAVKHGVERDKTRVIPLGITDNIHAPKNSSRKQLCEELRIPSNAPILLTVGRLVERKGVAWFVDNVMPSLTKKYPNLIYLVVGVGENEGKIKSAITRHNLTDHAKMLGKVSDEMMSLVYNGVDIFVQPNIKVDGDIEGFGRVLLEASLCELPIVAAGIEGIKDAIADQENGVLVETGDVAAYIREISLFINDNKKASTFGVKSRNYTLLHYRWESIAKEYIKGYHEITSI